MDEQIGTTTPGPRGKQRSLFILALLAIFLTGAGWALASPIGSSPDDDYHLGSIWCPRPVEGSCEVSYVDGVKMVEVPRAASTESRACYASYPEIPAACLLAISDDQRTLTDRYDEGNYPRGYYHLHHLLVGPDVEGSAIRMRLLNVGIATALIGLVAGLAPDRLRRAISVTVAATWFPMGVYFIASNNPTSWALTGLFAFAAGLYATSRSGGWRRWVLLAAAGMGALMCLASRYDVSFYLFVAALALLIAVPWRLNRHWPEFLVMGVSALLGAYWMFTSGNQSAIPSAAAEGSSATGLSIPHLVWAMATAPKYLGGFFGLHWGPGWGDVKTSEHAPFVLALLAFGAVVLLGTRRGSWRKWLSALVVLGAIVGLPAVFHATGIFEDLMGYQARYILPLFAVLVFLLLATGMEDAPWISRPQLVVLTALMSGAHLLTLYMTLLRFTKGTVEGQPRLLVGELDWWWNIPVSAIVVWTLTALLASLFFVLALSTVRRPVLALQESDGEWPRPVHTETVAVGVEERYGQEETQ